MDHRLKLGFLTPHNPYDRRAFSGTAFFAARALERHRAIDLRILGTHRPPGWLDRFFPQGETIAPARPALAGLDAVVGLVATSLLARVADVAPNLPLIHITDATPAFLRDEYGWAVPGHADRTEARLVTRAAATVYSSRTIGDRAGADLGLPGLRPETIPFGVNLDSVPDICPGKPSLNRLNLLFIGLDWMRKGGDVAVAALDALRAAGQDAELTIVGRCPANVQTHPRVTYAGYLDKNRARDMARLTRLLSRAHLLLLPTRGDCTPMVMAEAMVHGTPVIATDTGGVGAVMGGPGAGLLMPRFASPSDWATAIGEMTRDPDRYRFYSETAFDRARTELTWTSWSDAVARLAQGVLTADAKRGLKVAIGT